MRQVHWPGERQPTQWDASDASESSTHTALARFRNELLISDDAEAALKYCDEGTRASLQEAFSRDGNSFPVTYPVVLLEDALEIPSDDELSQFIERSISTWNRHVFLDRIPLLRQSPSRWPPYLKLAAACLATRSGSASGTSLATAADPELGSPLFRAGWQVWNVTLELDNRETRRFEAVLAAFLLILHGVMSSNQHSWNTSISFMSYSATMARRIYLTDSRPTQQFSVAASADGPERMLSALMGYLLTVDCVQAMHFDLIPAYSSEELSFVMPGSARQFRALYNSLLLGYPLPEEVKSREDGLMLLLALLNDALRVIRFHDPTNIPTTSPAAGSAPQRNANTPPFTLQAECARISHSTLVALEHWQRHFQNIGDDVLVLANFCRLLLTYSNSLQLSSYVGYCGRTGQTARPTTMQTLKPPNEPSDEAVDLAWAVLDIYDGKQGQREHLSAWLPVVFFVSALVIWYRMRNQDNRSGLGAPSLKVLKVFILELDAFPWDCAQGMAETISRLIRK